MGFQDAADCVAAYNSLPEPNKTILAWLLDFMKMVVAHSEVNKMTAQNIGEYALQESVLTSLQRSLWPLTCTISPLLTL